MKKVFASAALALAGMFLSSCIAVGPGVVGGVALWPKLSDRWVEAEIKQTSANGGDLTVELADGSQYVFHNSANYHFQNGSVYRIYYNHKTMEIKNIELKESKTSSAPPGGPGGFIYIKRKRAESGACSFYT